jgi:hypothetical protein
MWRIRRVIGVDVYKAVSLPHHVIVMTTHVGEGGSGFVVAGCNGLLVVN